MGIKGVNVEGRLDTAKRYHVPSLAGRELEEKSPVSPQVGVTAQELGLVEGFGTSPPKAPCWESLAGGVRVSGAAGS